ncbi:proline--tRNA ligase [Bartonella sp. DGB1]|uniref:proline--tRNA ligase n=1 Tax=Bartonella sp. DGB1 TaxID=3239807 RepID=UPI00352380B6
MRLSNYFLPILKEIPKEAEITSHRLMLRAGMIMQEVSGIYSWLPLGKKILDKISTIINEEQIRAGSLEILMPTIQPAALWQESGRYEDYGKEMLRISDRHGRDMLYGPTNEEIVTDIFRSHVKSYKDLPLNLYQIQWKFRDEIRPRFGVMRGREFLMKDGYSFDIDYESSRLSYARIFASYLRIFERLGVKAIPMKADTGPVGGDLSHEFIILADTGESKVYCDKIFLSMQSPSEDFDFNNVEELNNLVDRWTKPYAATEEMFVDEEWEKVPENSRLSARGIEVGHIFHFGDKYSAPMKANIMTADGKESPVVMGSYGIGVSRLVAAIIEASHDEYGIIWPKSIAPFDIGIINVKPSDETCTELSEKIYNLLKKHKYDVLLDDKLETAGAKFATMDLIGLPLQIIIGPKRAQNAEIEIKERKTGKKEILTFENLLNYLENL